MKHSFALLHRLDGSEVYVNVDMVRSFALNTDDRRPANSTCIEFEQSSLTVTETPREVLTEFEAYT